MRLRRLLALAVTSLVGSGVVVALSAAMLPPKQPVMMADPAFDAAAFYQTHATADRASRDKARAPGEAQSAQLPPPPPVARLNQDQTYNAYIIIEVGKQMQLPKRAYVVAIATALQETRLRNLANSKVPASLKLPHEGIGSDHDSVGLFQQRPSMGWGTVAQLMDPSQSAARFYAKLKRVTGWTGLSIAGAAQAVQRSAYPTAYAKHATHAQEIVNALTT
ncbi:MAG: hypothetical protein HKP61_06790 [Dactylosporangium sp.]|nr:hypothetical protein [Dactylosporangium sp.]NNJ60651.1 hypothetical protein [Dactylosporangium sp.]